MAESWKEHRGVMLLLLLAVIGIWGTVLYRVLSGVEQAASVSPDSAEAQVEARIGSARLRAEREPYEGRFRDPFRHTLGGRQSQKAARSPQASSESESAQEEERPPPAIRLELVGIVEETALLRQRGETYLVTAGDTVETRRGRVLVERVDPRWVVAMRKDRTDTLRLPRSKWAGRLEPEQ